ncbi:hypothetical protein Hypma_010434 [Hypsizygus marmoreus]|uniref:Uncharacterized protein n=1 Tax=Hypsizygus marmoreus TaxID=39966 RepID=A0A369K6H3_HYPMA|nr:hypothetical protein Hypma_010434 [Hypsizygus marmoreus]
MSTPPPASFGIIDYRSRDVSRAVRSLISHIKKERAARPPPPVDSPESFIDPLVALLTSSWVCNLHSMDVGNFLMFLVFQQPLNRGALLIAHATRNLDLGIDVDVQILEALRVELQMQVDSVAAQCTELNATVNGICALLADTNALPEGMDETNPRTNNLRDVKIVKLEEEEQKPMYVSRSLKC